MPFLFLDKKLIIGRYSIEFFEQNYEILVIIILRI